MACAVYALGGMSTDACLAGYVKINDEPTCTAAAASVRKAYAGNKTAADWPSGCYSQTNEGNAYLNLHPGGAPTANAQPLCVFSGASGPQRGRRIAAAMQPCTACAGGFGRALFNAAAAPTVRPSPAPSTATTLRCAAH